MEAAKRDYAMEQLPPSKEMNYAALGVSFKTDLSKVGGGAASDRIFGASGPVNQVDEERRLIDKVFGICDKDMSGSIDVRELKELLQLCNVDTTFIESSIDKIMSNTDQDFDGMISPQEFHAILSQRFEAGDSREEILKVFAKMDTDQDRFLSVEEILKVSAYMGETISREEIEDMIKVFSLDYQEQLRKHKAKPRGPPGTKPDPEPIAPVKMTEEDFIAVMHKTLGAYDQQGGAPEKGKSRASKSSNEKMWYQKKPLLMKL